MLICILTKNVITSCSVTMMLFLHLEVKPLMTLTTVLYLSCAVHTGLFFFQAEDGIRDHCVTGVQTCALPIFVAFDRYNKADWGLQKSRIEQLAKHWNNAIVWLDATGIGDPIYDDLLRSGVHVLPYKLTEATKRALINSTVLLIEQRQVRFPEIPVLVNGLVSYEYSRTLAGTLTMNAPEGLHDDAVIAFALSCWPLVHGGGGVRISDSQMERLRAPDNLRTEIGGINIMRREF